MGLISELHSHAENFARQLGCGGYDTSAAEADFHGYLKTVDGHDYPPWGARASWFDHQARMTSQSGTGNPLSPVIVVGSEFSAESDDYYVLYFKSVFDLYWQEVFDCCPCPQVVDRLHQDFIQQWGGAGTADKAAGYQHAPFYQGLRLHLQSNPGLLHDRSFVYKHMAYHSQRGGKGHQWEIISRLLTFLHYWPEYDKNLDIFSSQGEPTGSFLGDFDRTTLDDFVFCTESRLGAAAVGGTGENNKINGFLDHALEQFCQPRIFLLNPAGKDGMYDKLYKYLFPQVTAELEWFVPARALKKPLRLWRHYNGHYLVFSPTNLTGSISYNLLADIARLIRRAARKI